MADKIEKYIDLALKLSLKSKGFTSPNPLVGAVIVKNDKVLSTGFHRRAGLKHAEIIALEKAGTKAKGATLYVTLEPCSSFGRMPPCTDAIIKSGIKKVVVGMIDPNPRHRGQGIKILRKHNIEVISGILEKQIRQTNQPFIKYITKNMPYLTLKIAQSLDGKIATKTGDSRWITSEESRKFAHRIRSDFDAIMVGINTVLKDNPRLNPQGRTQGKKFYKIILDTHLKIKENMRIFDDADKFLVIIATSKKNIIKNHNKIKSLINKNAIILGVEEKNGLLDLEDLFRKLAQLEIANILAEGGGKIAGALLDENLVDYVLFFIAPNIIGGDKSIASIRGSGIRWIKQAREIKKINLRQLNQDLLVEGAVREY
ncbi:MAG: bifunctional diaminohydroxyphosphoribosylaminopyrimidine deaminase/5-amino-6-(5-phosphoribosylamino)uracil reductase RibD [Candidatus Omnitrophica bacterium]|nr:bifunctional diaminohydroxyphosphoribosylaminopyrimidine deaminase/5-amino-6-(5-phosphoribosylamino)uracil reductase RibD [Candidatus Omnitrophota bacterium]MDD5352815.1 bifunctional diaminohydroxyphosphoribosylaminopyrimidine deaminase/5-amino-6-(5-phosphoribosylamino)uracil reductase RibD [Candidatus Omnitrophota bacterium]MDD5550414.1 bifunctional diaminohydroxyphosphoribosylaminopyrimidine deaminase/5-amino-6-(5-phosphoribosylamino)uracil reductase RibD [Candidatus Omnitrophota bacterium]